jgi:hypothetical protein
MGDSVTDYIGKNTALNSGVTVASIGLEESIEHGTKAIAAGAAVQPAVWLVQYAANGSTPDRTDVGLYSMGVGSSALQSLGYGGPFGAIAAAGTSLVKGMVDDHTAELLKAVRASEPAKYAKGIFPVEHAGKGSRGSITASLIASSGGVAWQHPNGLWVYIANKDTRTGDWLPVCDYRPRKARTVYLPLLPLRPKGDGVAWTSKRGGYH